MGTRAPSIDNLTINGTDGEMTIGLGDIINISGFLLTGQGAIDLYENGTQIASGSSPLSLLRQYNNTGTYNITLIYNTTQNYTSNFENHTLTVIDNSPPNVTLVSPNNGIIQANSNITLTCNAANYQLANISLWINSTGTWQAHQTHNVSGPFNQSSFNMTNLPDGTYIFH